MPAVHQSHHNTELSVSRQVLKIRAVLSAFGHIGITRIEINARLHAVNLVIQIRLLGATPNTPLDRKEFKND